RKNTIISSHTTVNVLTSYVRLPNTSLNSESRHRKIKKAIEVKSGVYKVKIEAILRLPLDKKGGIKYPNKSRKKQGPRPAQGGLEACYSAYSIYSVNSIQNLIINI